MHNKHQNTETPTEKADRYKHWMLLGLFWVATFGGLYLIQRTNFLLFHGLAELFSIVVAGGVFLVAWNSHTRMESDFLLIVGISYAFVALLDALHLLAYTGMGVFPSHTSNLPTQLWLAARYIEAGSLLVGTVFIGQTRLTDEVVSPRTISEKLQVLIVCGGITAALIGAIFLGVFPDAYIDGVGLTPFKVVSEYLIIGLLAVALWQLYRHRVMFEDVVFRFLSVAIVLTMVAEFFFTLYVSVFGWSNMVGHLLKIASFYFIYRAVVKTGIGAPQELLFRQLTTERDRLAQREAELERQNERLNDFASIVSHDLRNPLNVAEGRLELAKEECDSDHLTAVEQSHDRIEALVDDLLTLARAGDTITEKEPVALADHAERAWTQVETGNARLRVETDATIQADGNRLSQLFENLFRNAVEHGGDDVTVRVGMLDDESGFYVEDDGPGIPESEREEIFDHGYTTVQGGTGFGLSIIKDIVEAHGWTIRVTAGANGGARFEITGVVVSA